MKRYIVFSGKDYYPFGGMADYLADCNTFGDAALAANADMEGTQWQQIYDQEENRLWARNTDDWGKTWSDWELEEGWEK